MAAKLKVTYLDGREVVVVVPPKVQVETERHFSGFSERQGVEQSYYLAWRSLNRAGKEPADFDRFLDLIEDIDQIKDGEVDRPTTADPSPGESSE